MKTLVGGADEHGCETTAACVRCSVVCRDRSNSFVHEVGEKKREGVQCELGSLCGSSTENDEK